MTATLPISQATEIFYPSEDGEPLAESYDHVYAIFKSQDTGFKKTPYEQLGVKEYWLFDPRGEWIKEKLRGYRLGSIPFWIISILDYFAFGFWI